MSDKLFIGIDSDVDKSGFAVYYRKEYLELTCLSLPDIFATLTAYQSEYTVKVRLEAGWLARGLNWHNGGNRSANSVGRNHEIGRQIEKYCITHNIECELVKPLGYSSYTHQYFCMLTKWPVHVRTNSDQRVAAMLVFGFG